MSKLRTTSIDTSFHSHIAQMLCALIGSGIQYKTLILTYATYTLDLETIANFYGHKDFKFQTNL